MTEWKGKNAYTEFMKVVEAKEHVNLGNVWNSWEAEMKETQKRKDRGLL